MKVTILPIGIGAFCTVINELLKRSGGLGSWRTSGDHQNYSIIENSQSTETRPRDLKRLAVTQTPVKNHQLKLM